MRTKQLTILVIAPYSKWFGVAVFSNSMLVHFAVCRYYNRELDVNVDLRHATEMIDRFRPAAVVVKALTARQAGAEKQLNILDSLRRVAATAGVPFIEEDLANTKLVLLKDRDATLEALLAKVGRSFPELARMAAFQNRSQREYYTPLLTAVAIGASIRIDKRKRCSQRPASNR